MKNSKNFFINLFFFFLFFFCVFKRKTIKYSNKELKNIEKIIKIFKLINSISKYIRMCVLLRIISKVLNI